MFIVRDRARTSSWFQAAIPALAVIGMLLVALAANVNNGLRQMISVYPLLAVIAGYGASRLLSSTQCSISRQMHKGSKIPRAGIVAGLFSLQIISSSLAHPDYLAYFNVLAGNHPEKIVVDSDLDWGQDLKRLSVALQKYNVKEFKISYNGSRDLDLAAFNFPPFQTLKYDQPESGWIAISIFNLTLGSKQAPYDQFAWLKAYQPVEKVGKSILLYHIPKN
ncbi:MAG: hypothetical protein HC800_25255 [Phormidesmis sp. RL_2_1]|nr:hypothetical protein [Phormidesmis sp. RL_2_1]